VGDGTIARCSCSGGTSAAGTAAGAPAAPGHEFDSTINRAIADGVTGRISAGNAVGFTVLGMLGNALFAPKATSTTPPPNPEQEQRALAAHQLNESGIYLTKQRDFAGAVNEFQQALFLAPNDGNIKHNLELAKEAQQKAAVAGRNSDALGQLLGPSQAGMGNFSSALESVDLGSSQTEGNLRNAPSISAGPETPQDQIDHVFSNGSSTSVQPDSYVSQQQGKETQDIDNLFQQQPAAPSPVQGRVDTFNVQCGSVATGSAAEAACQQQHAEQVQVEQEHLDQILNNPAAPANSDGPLKDSVADKSARPSSGDTAQPPEVTTNGAFGSNVAVPTGLQPRNPPAAQQTGAGSNLNTSAGAQVKAAAAISDGNLSPIYDEGTAKYAGTIAVPRATQQKPASSPINPSVQKALDANPEYQQADKEITQANTDLNEANQQLSVLKANPPSSQNADAIQAANQQVANALNAIDAANAKKSTIIKRIVILPASGQGQGEPPPPPPPPNSN
jgi:tetratricopeptide (TPR) repeat protein